LSGGFSVTVGPARPLGEDVHGADREIRRPLLGERRGAFLSFRRLQEQRRRSTPCWQAGLMLGVDVERRLRNVMAVGLFSGDLAAQALASSSSRSAGTRR